MDKGSKFIIKSIIVGFYKAQRTKLMSPMDLELSKTPILTLSTPYLAKN